MLSVEGVRGALRGAAAPPPLSDADGARSRAGVAIVLAGPPGSPSICFMERVKRHGDRWSGDIALPGGWARKDETQLRVTAMRETHEEVGIALLDAHHVGDVTPISISRNGRDTGLLGASVFYVGTAFPEFRLDAGEVADAFWIRCADLYDPARRSTVHWSRSGPPSPRPAIDVRGRVIWGLTYRMLVRFSDQVLGPRSPLEPDADR